MKRFLLTAIILFVIGIGVYAQQSVTIPSSSQIKQEAQQFSTKAKSTEAEFQTALDELRAGNQNSSNASKFYSMKSEIERLQARITELENSIKVAHSKGHRVSNQKMDSLEGLINTHTTKVNELEAFVAGIK